MRLNAGIFSFTGTRSNPLNIFAAAPLNYAGAGRACGYTNLLLHFAFIINNLHNLPLGKALFSKIRPQAQTEADPRFEQDAVRTLHTKSQLSS
jgi:hypothetical protein